MSFKQGHALVIGIGTHQHHAGIDVPVSVADTEAVASVLRDANTCGYPSEQVQPLCKGDATKNRHPIRPGQPGGARRAGRHRVPFHCGHGAPGTDGNYYLVATTRGWRRAAWWRARASAKVSCCRSCRASRPSASS